MADLIGMMVELWMLYLIGVAVLFAAEVLLDTWSEK